MSLPPLPPDERRDLAAEFALGVLAGAERAQALMLLSADPNFRADVERWTASLAPLLNDIEPVQPRAELWAAIEAKTAPRTGLSNVSELKRRVTIWRVATGAMTALAASLAVMLVSPQERTPRTSIPQTARAASKPMVAMIGREDDVKIVANWEPATKRLVLAVAGDMPSDPAHAHELWVIPAGGKPRSLGTMPGGRMTHVDLGQALAELLRQGSTIAISVEPPGGSRTGAPTGPVIASGTLESA